MAARRPTTKVAEAAETNEAPAEKASGLRVTAPLVQVILGARAVQFYKGDVLPEGLTPDSVEHLKSLGYVESDSK